jgi:arsenate reductase
MADDKRIYNVLFLCTGNSARSILGEVILNVLGEGRFKAYSAGSQPAGEVNPYTIALLERLDYPTDGLRSKSWDEFSGSDAPQMDFVFTVCDSAGKEACPVWPGHPMTVHWGISDPADLEGSDAEKAAAFSDAYGMLNNRISLLLSLPIESLDKMSLRRQLMEIGQSQSECA